MCRYEVMRVSGAPHFWRHVPASVLKVLTQPGMRASSSTCTCQIWRSFASSSRTTTPRLIMSLSDSTHFLSTASKWVSCFLFVFFPATVTQCCKTTDSPVLCCQRNRKRNFSKFGEAVEISVCTLSSWCSSFLTTAALCLHRIQTLASVQ